MAKYTIELRQYIESGGVVFDFDYPIFDTTYKSVLETKITDYYYFREIGMETIAQFKQFLKARLNLIMPYYNNLYNTQTEFLTKQLFYNKNLTDTNTRTNTTDTTSANNGTNNTTNTGDTTVTETFSDTPQSNLDSGLDYATTKTSTVNSGDTTVSETSSGNSTGNITTTEQYTLTSVGDDGMRYPASVYQEINDAFINIDMKIIDDLRGLFMNVY